MRNWKKTIALIWVSQFISLLTSSIVGYAIIYWLSIETKSPEVLAYAILAGHLPQAVLGLFIGVYIDRWNRKQIMILSDLFIALCTLLLFALLMLGSMELVFFYVLFACRSIGSAFHAPALQASIPLLVPESELSRIAGINQSIQSTCGIIAPVIGATLIGFWNIEYVLLLDVIGAIIAASSLLFIIIPSPQKAKKAKLIEEIKECFIAIRSENGLPTLFGCFTLVTFITMPVAVLVPFITISHFGGGSLQIGLVEMLWGIGALSGGFMVASKRLKINDVILINCTYILLGLYLIISGFLPVSGFIVFAVLTIIGGIAYTIYNALFVAIIQRNINPDVLGRVFSVFFSLTLLPSMIGIATSGFLAETLGITKTFVLGGLIIISIGIFALLIPSTRKLGKN